MDAQNPKQQLVEKLKSSANILVTVSSNPSVDQLSACLGLTIWLNKLGKHATAVFSGEVPSTLEFLQPEETLEKNTDSLRDFIIALDKSKADKLRYKVEDKMVKIFITPYRTSIGQDDLEFSQGDFNVDVVVCLGVREQADLDQAITTHGRILHDAAVATINVSSEGNELGSINWQETGASSLSELVVELGNELDKSQLDAQISTALLTGIVAETARFSNEKTSPQTMSLAAQLMSSGANQQLVASKLDEPAQAASAPENSADGGDQSADSGQPPANDEPPKPEDGTLAIGHEEAPEAQGQPEQPPAEQPPENSEPQAQAAAQNPNDTSQQGSGNTRPPLVTEPPSMGGMLTANTQPEGYDPTTDPLSLPNVETQEPLLSREPDNPFSAPDHGMPELPPLPDAAAPSPPPAAESQAPPEPPAPPADPVLPEPPPAPPIEDNQTLSDLEQSVHSPHSAGAADLDDARSAVEQALGSDPNQPLEPVAALGAQNVDLNLQHDGNQPDQQGSDAPKPPEPVVETQIHIDENGNLQPISEAAPPTPAPTSSPADQALDMPLPPPTPLGGLAAPGIMPPPAPSVTDPTAPPPVPPPMMPPMPFVNPNDPPKQ